MSNTVYVLNGPNLNLLGLREPEIYGSDTLDDIAARLEDKARALGLAIDMRQSNHEGHSVRLAARGAGRRGQGGAAQRRRADHTSLALYDAIRSIKTPVIEVHISNPAAREAYRHKSFVAMAAKGTIAGFGAFGYELALEAAARL